jgi:hypothetical protein
MLIVLKVLNVAGKAFQKQGKIYSEVDQNICFRYLDSIETFEYYRHASMVHVGWHQNISSTANDNFINPQDQIVN